MSILKPYREFTLAELRVEHASFEALLDRTWGLGARKAVQDVIAIVATWISQREREERQGVAA